MESEASSQIKSILLGLQCPNCNQNLISVQEATVQCPQCGDRLATADLVIRKWSLPWHQAPHYGTLGQPGGWILLGSLIFPSLMFFFPVHSLIEQNGPVRFFVLTGSAFSLIWLYFMVGAFRAFNQLKGVLLAFLMHVVIVGYLASAAGCVFAVVGLFVSGMGPADSFAANSGTAAGLLASGLFFAASVSVGWACRQAEKLVARCCIKHDIQRHLSAIALEPPVAQRLNDSDQEARSPTSK